MRRSVLLSTLFVFGLFLVVQPLEGGANNREIRSQTPSTPFTLSDISESAGIGWDSDLYGHSAVWADIDTDQDPDLFVTRAFGNPIHDYFYANDGNGVFSEAGTIHGIADGDGGSHGACFADLDNDQDYDHYNGTTKPGTEAVFAFNNVYRNDAGMFTDVTEGSGVPIDSPWATRGVVCFDMDADGDIDLFAVSNYRGSDDPPTELNELFRNDGDWQFTPVEGGDVLTAPAGQGVTDTDFDGDGDVDIIASNRTGDVNILRNDGSGNFSLVTPASIGITHDAPDGTTSADIDNDGDLDLLLSGDNFGNLYKNDGDGTFTHVQAFSSTDGYMGNFADLDHDGDLDLVFAGDDIVYINDGNGAFSEGPSIPVTGIIDPRAIAFADIENDGDLDFAIGVKGTHNWLIRNNLDGGNWLKIQLISPSGQAGAFGAKVFIYDATDDSLIGMREAHSIAGYLAQNDPILHFGLGNLTAVDVRVEFLNGDVEVYETVSAEQTFLVDPRTPSAATLRAISSTSPDNHLHLLLAVFVVNMLLTATVLIWERKEKQVALTQR
jgi:hypothetical protein